MTTIAYRDGIIAADTGLTSGTIRDCHMDKIVKREDGAVAGAAGEAWWIAAFLEWFHKGGELPVCKGSSQGLVVDKRRRLTIYESSDGTNRSFPIRAKYYAVGSGSSVALGALFSGANPVQAVKAALLHDDATHGRILELKVGW